MESNNISNFLNSFPDCVIQFFDDNKHKKDKALALTRADFNWDMAVMKQQEGCGVYFSINGFKDGRRIEKNLTKINAVCADIDNKDGNNKIEALENLTTFSLPPHFVIETKNGLQAIWLVTGFDKAKFSKVVDSLIKVFNADPGAKDICRVLRLPGFKHLKDSDDPFECRLIQEHKGQAYAYDDFGRLIGAETKFEMPKELPPVSTASKEIRAALEIPLETAMTTAADRVGVKLEFSQNSSGKKTIIEDGEITSGFISETGEFCHSMSGKNRKGNQIIAAEYYLNELGGLSYNRQQIAEFLLKNKKSATSDADFHIIELSEFLDLDIPKASFLVDGLIPNKGLTMINGLPGTYKTWLYLHIIDCIANGKNVFGLYITKPTNILLVNVDDNESAWQDRVKRITTPSGNKIYNLMTKGWNFSIIDNKEKLGREIADKNIGLVIFDTFRQIHPKDENNSAEMNEVIGAIKSVAEPNNCAAIIIHHDAKDTKNKTSVTSASGSVAISGNMIAAMQLKRVKGCDNRISFIPYKNKVSRMAPGIILEFAETPNAWDMFTIPKLSASDFRSDDDVLKEIMDFYRNNSDNDLSRNDFVDNFAASAELSKSRIRKLHEILTIEGYLVSDMHDRGKKTYRINPDNAEEGQIITSTMAGQPVS